ncbi:MAG: hypothetical protein ACOYON_02005 [Fimbriimonas sp.]
MNANSVDRKPIIAWPVTNAGSDASFDPTDQAEKVWLVEVANPFGLALAEDVDLNEALAQDPAKGDDLLHTYVTRTREAIQRGLSQGADGVLYRLHGASPAHCSPMQYGGHYLELDREILEEVRDAALNVIFTVGDADVYIDFVSDLPANLFAWDSAASGVTASQVRTMRSGLLAAADPEADVAWITGVPSVAQHLENRHATV